MYKRLLLNFIVKDSLNPDLSFSINQLKAALDVKYYILELKSVVIAIEVDIKLGTSFRANYRQVRIKEK